MTEDIVCNKPLAPEWAIWATRYHGRTFNFCSLMCKERFELEPEDYLTTPREKQVPPAVMLGVR